MNARVTFRQSTLSQEGTVGKILRYVQDNPRFVQSTNIVLLTRLVCQRYGMANNTVRVTINRMLRNQMLMRHGGKKHAKFYINYYQKDIPGYILERAPQDVQERVRLMKENLAKDQYIDEAGCVVTKCDKPEKKQEEPKEEEPAEEPKEEPKEEKPVEKPVEKSTEVIEKQDVVVPVQIKDDKGNMNITITLNLNINR